ncbi:MAG: mechanosensitive ion channel domain-containing protein [Candidatus Hodarchaeales archaeon]|jgi:hypothetical protein
MNQSENSLIDVLNMIIGHDLLIVRFLALIFLLVIIWIGGKSFNIFISRIQRFPPDLLNGLKFLTNIFQLYLVTLGFFTIIGASQEFLLGLSALIVTVIGFASTSVASNIFGGFYLIVTRPFKVGDLIKTQGTVGIVEEIGLNTTRIIKFDRTTVTIPNNNLINASLLNYNVDKKNGGAFFSTYFKEGTPDLPSVVYRSSVELQLNFIKPPIPLSSVKERLDQVCEEFTPIFGFKPKYYFGHYDFRLKVRLLIFARSGYLIFNSWPFFIESIVTKAYRELQNVEETGL